MIDVTFHVWCDAEINGEMCEAEFFHEQLNSLGRTADLHDQLVKRGWSVLRLDHGRTNALCPLHRRLVNTAAEGGEVRHD